MSSKCKVCGRGIRKARLVVIRRGSSLGRARVCNDCEAKFGVTILFATEAPHCKCGNPATKCHLCAGIKGVDKKDESLKTIKSQLAGLKMVERMDGPGVDQFVLGKIEAYEGVIALLEGKAA